MTTMTTMTASYRKTKQGQWVVMAPVAMIEKCRGAIRVTKRDGSSKIENYGRLGSPFNVNGTKFVYAYITKSAPQYTVRAVERAHCGYPCPVTRRKCTRTDPCHDCQ